MEGKNQIITERKEEKQKVQYKKAALQTPKANSKQFVSLFCFVHNPIKDFENVRWRKQRKQKSRE